MQIKKYDLFVLHPPPPPDEKGWEIAWHGLYHLEKSTAENVKERDATRESPEFHNAFTLEKFALMSILEELGPTHVNLFELGCGRAPWCLSLAGAIQHHFVPEPPTSYRVMAVEAEPTHFAWARSHLQRQGIHGDVVHGAITAELGTCRFLADTNPAEHMGQAVHRHGNISVPSLTVDYLRELYEFERIHILHMDIQGMEVEAIKGAQQSLNEGLIDYFIIGTHGPGLESEIKKLLGNTHHLIVELPSLGTIDIDGIKRPFKSFDDGVQVYKNNKI